MNHSSDNNEILKSDNHLKLSEQWFFMIKWFIMIKEEYKYFEQEVIYQRDLEFEMSSQGIDYLKANDLDSNKNQDNPGIKWITVQTIMTNSNQTTT